MVDKYIYNNAGTLTERELLVTSAGAGSAGRGVALDGTGRLDSSVMPTGIGADTASIQASENLAAGDYVNVWDSAGNFRVRKADAASDKPAHGFVIASVTSAAAATVYFEGSNGQVTGMTAGTVYLSASTPGLGTNTAPSGAGNLVQRLGVATQATAVNVEIGTPIKLA